MTSVEIRFLSYHQAWRFFLIHENASDRWGEVSGTELLRNSHISLAKGKRERMVPSARHAHTGIA